MEDPVPMGITAELAQFTADIRLDRLPPEVVQRTRFLVLDLVGNIVRGRHDAESTPSLLAAARAMGLAAGSSGVFGDAARYTPAGAAFLNGALAHTLDFDDTHAAGTLHPGAPVIPAALAAGEMVGASGADVLPPSSPATRSPAAWRSPCPPATTTTAATTRPRPAAPSARPPRRRGSSGWTPGRSGRLRHRAEPVRRQPAVPGQRRLDQALPGRLERDERPDGRHAGARRLQRRGGGLRGPAGFLRAYAPNPIPERAVQGLGTEFELMQTAVKPYPSCRYGHAGIDAALALRAELDLKPEEIESGHDGPAEQGHAADRRAAGEEGDPQNVVDGQFSGPFVISPRWPSALWAGTATRSCRIRRCAPCCRR